MGVRGGRGRGEGGVGGGGGGGVHECVQNIQVYIQECVQVCIYCVLNIRYIRQKECNKFN